MIVVIFFTDYSYYSSQTAAAQNGMEICHGMLNDVFIWWCHDDVMKSRSSKYLTMIFLNKNGSKMKKMT